jgi:hypothetical protein
VSPAEIITTAAGAVEVETHGSGTPVIVVHGSPGGVDAARAMSRFLATTNIAGPRQAGWRNDVANFARIGSLDLGRVRCPVLLVHGDADTDAPIGS